LLVDLLARRPERGDVVFDLPRLPPAARSAVQTAGLDGRVEQRGEPEAVRRFVAHRARDLAAQDRVLVSRYKQLGVLGVAAQQHRRDRQQPPGHLVQQ
jgi:hypothetical protein